MPPRRGRSATRVAAVVAGASLAVLAGCTEEAAPPPPAPPTTVPLGEIDLSGLTLTRAPFCDDVPEASVTDVLGGEPRRTGSWESGDRRRVDGSRDVVHEFGCSYRRGPREANAWLFAQPVTRRDARALVRQQRSTQGCTTAGELGFGRPGLVQRCDADDRLVVTLVGRFGDAWLTCRVASPSDTPADDELERAQRWCVEVAYAAQPG